MEKHYWKKNELVYLRECYLNNRNDEVTMINEFNKKYPNINKDQINKAFNEYKWLKEE